MKTKWLPGILVACVLLLVPALVVLALPLAYLPAFYPHPRYVFTSIGPVLMLGCWQLAKRFSPEWADQAKSPLARASVWIPILIVFAYTLVGARGLFLTRVDASESPQLAAWVSTQIPANAALITSDPTIPFYSGHRFVRLPRDDFNRVLIYARYQRAKFFLMLKDDLAYYNKAGALSRAESAGSVRQIGALSSAGEPKAILLSSGPGP